MMPTTDQEASAGEACPTSRPVYQPGEPVPRNPQAPYYCARYYHPTLQRFISEDPLRFIGGVDFYTYVHDSPLNLTDPFGLKDYNDQETLQLLQQAYQDATAGYFSGLGNIFEHHRGWRGVPNQGDYDFGHNDHQYDTFTRCGRKMTASEFGNYIAGFDTGAWDDAFYGDREIGFNLQHTWQLRYAEATARAFGVGYHLANYLIPGQTNAENDPLDKTGFPWITMGANDGRTFSRDGGMTGRACGCNQ